MQTSSNSEGKQNPNNFGGAGVMISRDEMNLAEFPLTVLSTRVDPNLKTLEFKDSITGKNGREIKRQWIITGTDKFGLPTASDDEVLLGLLKLTVDNQFSSKKISFTRYELLKILQWSTEGKNYTRLQKALDRLSGVRIKATNAFFDNDTKNHSTKNFGIIDAYEINDGRDSKPKPSFFIWSDEIFSSFKSGFIKKLDLDFYLNLNSSVAKRLYRYLDKNFWYKAKIQMSLFTLAHEKIGISRNYKYASSLKQQLESAVEELVKLKFLAGVEYVGKGKGTEVIFYSARGTPRSVPQETKPADTSDENGGSLSKLIGALTKRGLREGQAIKLLTGQSAYLLKKTAKLIEYFDHLTNTHSSLISRSPVGFLYRAVENIETFSLPKEYEVEQKKAERPGPKPQRQDQDVELKKEYDLFVATEVERLRPTIEPTIITEIEEQVKKELAKVEGLISEERYQETIKHGIEQKIAKLLALPSYPEWLKHRK